MEPFDLPECFAVVGIFGWSFEVRHHLDTCIPDTLPGLRMIYLDSSQQFIWFSRWFISIYLNIWQVSGFSGNVSRFAVTSIPRLPHSSSGFSDNSSGFTRTFGRYWDFCVILRGSLSPRYPFSRQLGWFSRWFIWIYPNVWQVSGFSCDLTRFVVTSIPVFQTAHLENQMVYLNLPEHLAGIEIFVRAFEVHLILIPHFPDSSSGFTTGIRIFGKTCDKTR